MEILGIKVGVHYLYWCALLNCLEICSESALSVEKLVSNAATVFILVRVNFVEYVSCWWRLYNLVNASSSVKPFTLASLWKPQASDLIALLARGRLRCRVYERYRKRELCWVYMDGMESNIVTFCVNNVLFMQIDQV